MLTVPDDHALVFCKHLSISTMSKMERSFGKNQIHWLKDAFVGASHGGFRFPCSQRFVGRTLNFTPNVLLFFSRLCRKIDA